MFRDIGKTDPTNSVYYTDAITHFPADEVVGVGLPAPKCTPVVEAIEHGKSVDPPEAKRKSSWHYSHGDKKSATLG
jgi:hypothetical protein